MCEKRLESSEQALRIVVEAHLPQHASAVVVDAFAGDFSLFVECVESA